MFSVCAQTLSPLHQHSAVTNPNPLHQTPGVAPSCAGDLAPSEAQQSGGNWHISDAHSASLSAARTLRTCPRDAELRHLQVCAGCLFPHVKVVSRNSQQAVGNWNECRRRTHELRNGQLINLICIK